MSDSPRCIVVLGTGGTIAGRAARPADHVGYRAGELAVADLLAGVPVPPGVRVEARQLAQLDSKDMDFATWQALHRACAVTLERPDVAAVVVTHGTDTLEETAYFLHRSLRPAQGRPVVFTAAMRPASAASPDGPQNLADALAVAAQPDACGVMLAFNGQVLAAPGLRKLHGYRIDAFGAGEAGPLGLIEDGRLRVLRPWLPADPHGADVQERPARDWPWVEIVTSAAGARPELLDALLGAGVAGLVLAGTGNGTLPAAWAPAIRRLRSAGVSLRRASRCLLGGVVGEDRGLPPSAGALTPAQARVELLLDLLQQPAGRAGDDAVVDDE